MGGTWTLRMPFDFEGTTELGIEGGWEGTLAGLACRYEKNEEPHHGYRLIIEGFESEEDARGCLGNLRGEFMRWLLEGNVSVVVREEIRAGPDAPEFMNARHPVIYEGARPKMILLTAHGCVVNLNVAPEGFREVLERGISGRTGIVPEALETAVDLYRAHVAEVTPRAKFLTLVLALESLVESAPLPPELLDLVDGWRAELQGRFGDFERRDVETLEAAQTLDNALDHAQAKSVRWRIANLVRTSLENRSDREQWVLDAKKVYDHRSTIAHTGTLDPNKLHWAETRAREILKEVLLSRLPAHP